MIFIRHTAQLDAVLTPSDHHHSVHCDQPCQEGPQLPDARLRQQREEIEDEDSVVRPQVVLARANWRATKTGHGSGNPSASWKERASCHGEWQRSSARLRRRGAQEKRPELSRRTGGWRSEAPAGWGCLAWPRAASPSAVSLRCLRCHGRRVAVALQLLVRATVLPVHDHQR